MAAGPAGLLVRPVGTGGQVPSEAQSGSAAWEHVFQVQRGSADLIAKFIG